MKSTISSFMLLALLFAGCSKEATEAANSSALSPESINGSWKETTTGLVIRITGVSASANGRAVVTSVGTAFPSGALGGTCMTEVEHQSGGYWDAYNHTYYPSYNGGGARWVQSSIVGLAMNTAKTEFKIGTKVYKKQ